MTDALVLNQLAAAPPLRSTRGAVYVKAGALFYKFGTGAEVQVLTSQSPTSWGAITGTLSAQTDLQAALDAKSGTGHGHSGLVIVGGTLNQVLKKNSGTDYDYSWQDDATGSSPTWGTITGTLSNQTDLNTALSGKSATGHGHAISDVTSLQSSLDAKATAGHDQSVTLSAGTYTPTITNGANVAASSGANAQYMRVGNTVTVSGRLTVDVTTVTTNTILGISLPIASNFTASDQCGGTGAASDVANEAIAINADITNDRAQMQWLPNSALNKTVSYIFTYVIA